MAVHPNSIANLKSFAPGVGGRKMGAREKINKRFLNDLYEVYQTEGIDAIRRVCKEKPVEFVKVLASLIPKEMTLNLKENPFDNLTVEQLQHLARNSAEYIPGNHGGIGAQVIEGQLCEVHHEDIDGA